MSLINQMLQDLEKRRASADERGALPDQVRVLPAAEAQRLPWSLLGVVAAVILIAGLVWYFKGRLPVAADAATQLKPDASMPSAVLAPGAPASRLALDLAHDPSGVARSVSHAGDAATRSAAPGSLTANDAAKTPTPLVTSAVVATDALPSAKPAANAPGAEAAKSAAPAAETPKPSAATPFSVRPSAASTRTIDVSPDAKGQAVAANAQIDKRVQILTPQQLAENDYREAVNNLNQGRLAEAQEGFRRALQHNPAHAGARQGLFGLLLDAKKNTEAEQLLQEGLKLNINQPALAIALASMQYERGDAGGAIETMQKTAPAAQSSPDYLARLAGLLQRQSRHREAVEQYQAALRLAPQSGVWMMGLGISLQALERNAEAQEAFRRAKASNTLNAELQAFVDQRLRQLQ